MLKNILNLSGAQVLSKNEQKSVTGGCPSSNIPPGPGVGVCRVGQCWVNTYCTSVCSNGTRPLGC